MEIIKNRIMKFISEAEQREQEKDALMKLNDQNNMERCVCMYVYLFTGATAS
jgi:hypothetical protein